MLSFSLPPARGSGGRPPTSPVRSYLRLAVALLALTLGACSLGPPPPPTPTVAIPPEALSGLATAVAAMSTQAAQMRTVVASVQPVATPTPSPTPEDEAAEPVEVNVAVSATPRPAPAPRPAPVLSATDAAPCAVGQIKGNRSSRIFHVPGGGSYARTKASVVCFDTEAQAIAEGFRKALN